MSVFLGTGKHVNGTSLIWDQFPSDTSCLYFIQIQTSVKKMSLLCCSGGIIVRTRASISETTLYAILHHSEQAATLPSEPQLEFPPLFRAEIWNKSFKSLSFPLVFHTVIVGSERELSSPTGETIWLKRMMGGHGSAELSLNDRVNDHATLDPVKSTWRQRHISRVRIRAAWVFMEWCDSTETVSNTLITSVW